jgi:rod shape-determining protein MreC
LLNRYRNLTILLLILAAQLVLVAYQVRTGNDVRLLRVWSVSAVTPLARLLDSISTGASGALRKYVALVGVEAENRRLLAERDRLKIENRDLRAELATAQRAEALKIFQQRAASKTIAARSIGTGTATGSRVILLDRGATSGVKPGMAVINAEGVIGKIAAAYPSASHVLLITDSNFAAGVIGGKNKVRGTLKGHTGATCLVDYVENEEKVEVGEWFYTSGDDRLFPRGLPVGQVRTVAAGKTFKEIIIVPSGLARGLEEALIVLEPVHETLPDQQTSAEPSLLPPPPADPAQSVEPAPPRLTGASTDADLLVEKYRAAAEAQRRYYGDNQPPPKTAPVPVKP